MDPTDLGIVRWMYPDGIWVPWGVDPRVSASEIGRHVGLGRTAVWSRIRRWEQEGFFKPYEVRPNYHLFGVGLHQADLHITDPVDATSVMDTLESIDGVTSAWVGFGDTDSGESVERVSVCFVDDRPGAVDRRMRVFRRLSTEQRVDGPFAYRVPAVTRIPSSLDWRVMAALRAQPRSSLSSVARLLGITLKTLIRHRDGLLESNAIWYFPEFDWAIHPSVALHVFYEAGIDPSTLLRGVAGRFPDHLPMSLDDMGFHRRRRESANFLGIRVPARSPDDVQSIMIQMAKVRGVLRVRSDLEGPWRFYARWIDRKIRERLGETRRNLPLTA